MDCPESDPLVPKPSSSGQAVNSVSKWNFFLKLSLFLLFFSGSEEMANVTVKQYVFTWCVDVNTKNGSSGNTTDSNNSSLCGNKQETAAQEMASRWELYFNLLNAVLVYFAVSFYGTLSDYVGRKVFVCLGLLGWAARSAVISFVIFYELHIAWILVAYGIDGLAGSLYTVNALTIACTADRTSGAKERAFAIALVETVLCVAKLVTQFGNGYFIHSYGYFYPMLTSTGLTLCALAITVLFLNDNEDLKTQKTRPQKEVIPSFKTLFRNYVGFYTSSGDRKDRAIFWICLCAFFLIEFATLGRSDSLILYQLGPPFCWSSETIGWYNAAYYLVTFMVGCILLKMLQRCLSDTVICYLGSVSAIGYCLVTGLATNTLWLFVAIGSGFLMMLPKAVLRGTASSRTSSHLQGALFAGLESSELICKMVASPSALSLYAATLVQDPGLVFIVLGGVYAVSLLFIVYLSYLLRRQNKEQNNLAVQSNDLGNTC